MKITFFCDSCRSELTVASSFIGRTILCPRCRRKTQIPATSVPEPPPTRSEPVESSSSFVKICADAAPNPFAFSVRLDLFVDENDASVADGGAPDDAANASKTPSVDELIAPLRDEENR
ncbi:MAG: hypothetical protein IKU86_09840 [Thermoguttaceae bacterium]|nr:hypothetical protein [Thermoguttaceae bacterium]